MEGWKYWDKLENIEDYYGFIYKIVDKNTGKFYIGKKSFWSIITKPLTQKELSELTDKRQSKKKKVTKESNWKVYFGSNKELLDDVKKFGHDRFERHIIKLCKTKKQQTYWELHFQCTSECIVGKDRSYNSNILGKFYPGDLVD